jgi:signal transduction histidine kinase
MKPRAWGSSICRGVLAAIACLPCLGSAADDQTATPRIAFSGFEYFSDYFGALPPAQDARAPRIAKGSIAVPTPVKHRARWLRARFALPEAPQEVFGLYVAGANRGLRAFVNGVEVGNTSLADAETFGWNYPLFFSVPPALLRAGENTLDLRLTLTTAGHGSLHGAELGSHDALKPQYDRVLFWRVTGPQITTLIAVLLAAIALLVWLRRRNESVYGWFGLACLLAAVRNTHFFVTAPISESWYEIWAAVPLHWMSVALIVFSFRLCGQRYPRLERALLLAALAWSLAIVVTPQVLVVDLGYLWLFAVSIATLAYAAIQCWRAPRLERVFLLIAVVVSIALGALDFLLLTGLRDAGSRIYLMPYSTLLFSLAMGAVLVDAFAKARTQQERLNQELDARLAVRELQLAEHHQQLMELERQRTAATERQRILRDIHDGLGSQLISSIQLVEAGTLNSPAIAAVLRECVDDLRLAIDSLKPAGDDLLLVLGNFRYRMEPRLTAAGVGLEWKIDAQARSPALTSEQVLHTLRIVQEAFTNALKHAQPSKLSIRYENDERSAWALTIADDGTGFQEPADGKGDGLRNMRTRAAHAGAELKIESSEKGTVVRISGGVK